MLRLSLDIGNTQAHAGIVSLSTFRCIKKTIFPTNQVRTGLSDALRSLVAEEPVPFATYACGVQELFPEIEKAARAAGIEEIRRVCFHKELPVTFDYQVPEKLGADRIADCLFAHKIFPERNVILIDAGTAITIDLLQDSGNFAGGAILPGLSAQAASFSRSAPALPLLKTFDPETRLPGTSTEACMNAGILYGTAGALERCIAEYRKIIVGDYTIIATGGDWNALKPFVTFAHDYIPDCTIIGVALFEPPQRR